jgi:hypothetical protein
VYQVKAPVTRDFEKIISKMKKNKEPKQEAHSEQKSGPQRVDVSEYAK